MNKSILFLLLSLSIGACKSDVNREALTDKTSQSEAQAKIAEASVTDSSDTTTPSGTLDGITEGTDGNSSVTATKEEPKKATKKRVKKKSFNPPHIAVLEQDEYEPYEEEVEKKTEPKEEKKKVVVKEVAATVKTKKASTTEKVIPKATPAKVVEVKKQAAVSKVTEIVFRRNFFSFGDIVQGDTVRFNFDFTNIGEAPLIIENAKGSCSCTHPEYPLLPIEPGQSGKISGIYVSDGKVGPQNASVTITANTEPSTHQLLLDGAVSMSEESEAKGDKN